MGYMRELGEGIPRIFRQNGTGWLLPSRIQYSGGRAFSAHLRNWNPYMTKQLLGGFKNSSKLISQGNKKRCWPTAHAHGGYFTSPSTKKVDWD